MPHYRTYKSQKEYDNFAKTRKKDAPCQFCELTNDSTQVVKIFKNFKVIKNIFPYSNWDARKVIDHLMVVPNVHTETLSSLGNQAAIEFVSIISEYETVGYDVYARSPHSTVKSVPHQHTHLIKTGGKKYKVLLHLVKPYISFTY